MLRFFLATFLVFFVNYSFATEECLAPPSDQALIICRTKAKVSVGLMADQNPNSPKLSILVDQTERGLSAQVYAPSGGCTIHSRVHDVKIVGQRNASLQCELTLSDTDNYKKLQIKMVVGGSDQLIHYDGKDVTQKDIHELECSTDFYDEIVSRYCPPSPY